LFKCFEAYGKNCRCEALAKEATSLDGQLLKNNNNRHLLAFLSLLTTHEVFDKVQLGFLVVGHTHEDINNFFGYLSKKMKSRIIMPWWI
jgi:hypothetical protein